MHDQRVSSVSPDVSAGQTIPALPGAFFLSTIPGLVGRGVSALQAFARGGSLWTHAGIYVGDGQVVQAEPGGVKLRDLPDWLAPEPLLWSDAPIQRHLASLDFPPAWPSQYEKLTRQRVVKAALDLVHSPYAWLDYLTIAGAEWRVPGWERIRGRVDKSGALLCSSLVDRAYTIAGIHLFTDHRPPGQVTPADLARYDEAWIRFRVADLERRLGDVEKRLP
jgi:hypothetical protein